MPKFRKKSVVIDAVRWTGDNGEAMQAFAGAASSLTPDMQLTIHTLEGDMHAAVGDWIIRGVKGEIYPCKPDIFAATYDEIPVEPASVPSTPPPNPAQELRPNEAARMKRLGITV